VSRTHRERLTDISNAVDGVRGAVQALEQAEALQPQVPWREIAKLRDLLAHDYYRVDAQVIRRTVETPMEQLSDAVAELIAADTSSPADPSS
jgi:uncharacterized protein with HEPN domain